MKNRNKGNDLKSRYDRYLIGSEEPVSDYRIGFHTILVTNQRIICLRRFPSSFTPVEYKDIVSLEHHVYISWEKLIKGIILLAVSFYGYRYPHLRGILDGVLSFLEKNVPEISDVIASVSTSRLMEFILIILVLFGILCLIQFLLSLVGKLRITTKEGSSIRIRTPLTRNVRDIIRTVEELKEYGENYARIKKVEELKELGAGQSCLVEEEKPQKSLELFLNEIKKGSQGLYISRTNPKQIKSGYDLGDVKILWLTDSLTEQDSVPPELEKLFALLNDFIEKNEKSVILLDGVEYLITHNNFEQILRLIQGIKDRVGICNSRLIIPINPQTLSRKEIALLEREMSKTL